MSQTTQGRPERVAPPSPSPGEPALALDDPRVIRALEEYRAVLEAGGKPDRQAFQARHPELSQALAECLDGLDFIHLAAPQLQPAADTSSSAIQPEGPLGDYRIVREIGRGGMGVVYEAVQISLGRRVALKVLPFAAALDAKQLQRFKNEAQAAAHLHHTNIVPVFGIGCERSVHFYAMQFIDGQTLAALIQEMRPLAGLTTPEPSEPAGLVSELARELASGCWAPPPRPAADPQPTGPYRPVPEAPAAETAIKPAAVVSTEHSLKSPAFYRTVAQLGRQAAEALEHAHQLGVVHRDIKPANLLVDGRGNLWITDFGLAHCQSQAGLTMTGDLVGTLRYMSPEQALAKRVVVDHRTDVYSLGATLYELLTLEPVFNGRDRQELLRQIAFEEPKSLRRLNTAIPAELETVVLKAMEKNPADRYATARELADDLERYLKDEPIRARRASLVQRARKFAVRHRSVVVTLGAALVLFLVASVVALAVSNMLISREEKQKAAALIAKESALEEKEVALNQAEARLTLVLAALDEVYITEAEKRFAVYLKEPNQRPAQDSRQAQVERDFLQKGLGFYEKLIQPGSAEPAAQFQMGKAYRRVGIMQAELQEYDKAEGSLGKAISLLHKLAEEFPVQPQYRLELADAHRWQGHVYLKQEQWDKAAADYTKAIALKPDDWWLRHERGYAYAWLGQLDKAVADYTKGIELDPRNRDFWLRRGETYRRLRQRDKALADYMQAITLEPRDAWAVWAWCSRGNLCAELGEWDKAAAEYTKVIELSPRNWEGWFRRGEAYRHLGQPDKALADYMQAITLEPSDEGASWVRNSRGQLYAELGEWDKAAADFAQAIKLKPDEPITHYWHALARLAVGDQPGYRSACAGLVQHFARTEKAETGHWVAWTCALAPGAVDDWKSPLRLAEQAGRSDPKNATFSTTLGAVLYRAGRIEEDIQRLQKTTKMFEEPGADKVKSSPAYPWFFLALAHQGRGDGEEARRCLEKAIELAERELKTQVPWNCKLTLELLRREATAAIRRADKK